MSDTKKFYTPYDISELLNICYSKALDFIKYSGLPYTKVGRVYRVKVDDFDKFIAGESK